MNIFCFHTSFIKFTCYAGAAARIRVNKYLAPLDHFDTISEVPDTIPGAYFRGAGNIMGCAVGNAPSRSITYAPTLTILGC